MVDVIISSSSENSDGSDSELSDTSEDVSDTWSELEDEDDAIGECREAQEAVIQEQFDEAVEAFKSSEHEHALKLLFHILFNPVMQELCVRNWSTFDWDAAMKKSTRFQSNMTKIFYSTNLAIAGMVECCVPFYLQALAVRPEVKEMWFECGQAAAKGKNWPTGEMCFKMCGDDFRAKESLLLMYFVSGDYIKCVALLKEIFEKCESHCVGHVIKAAVLRRNNPFFTKLFAQLFTSDLLTRRVERSIEEKVLLRLESFKSRLITSANDDDKINDLFFGNTVFTNETKFLPYSLILRRDMGIVQLGGMLCDAFDRIECFSSFVRQIVCAVEEKASKNDGESLQDIVVAAEQMDVDDAEAVILEKTADEEILCEAEALLGSLLDSVCEHVSAADEAKRKKSSKRSVGRRLEDQGIVSDDELLRRRSTRFVEDVAASPLGVQAARPPENAVQNDLNRIMGLDDVGIVDIQPFSFPSASSSNSHASFDDHAEFDVDESILKSLICVFLENPGTSIEFFLKKFLTFIAVNDGCCKYNFSSDDTAAIRKLYTRWRTTFANKNFNAQFSAEELSVHMLAAELGSPLALSTLQQYFFYNKAFTMCDREAQGRSPGLVGDASTADADAKQLIISNNLSNRFNSVFNLCQPSTSSSASIVQEADLDKSSRGLSAKRMKARRKAFLALTSTEQKHFQRLLDRLAATKADGISLDINGPAECVAENASDSVGAVDSIDLSEIEKQKFYRLEIRFRWLTSMCARPTAVGFAADSAEYIIFRFWNLIEIARRVRGDELIYSRARPHQSVFSGMNCISLRNVCQLLCVELRQLYQKQIEILRDAEDYEELFDILLSYCDGTGATEESQNEALLLLTKCAVRTSRYEFAVRCTLTKVLSSESCAAETFQRLIDLWEAIELAALDKPTLCGLAAVVCEALASDCPLLYGSVDFWIFAYKIAKHRESDNRRTEAEMNAFYTSGVNAGGFLPTRALCLLSIAHEILAQAEACANFEGKFLRFFMDELYAERAAFCQLIVEHPNADLILENVSAETYQCLACGFSDSLSKLRGGIHVDHGSRLSWRADWRLAELALPLIIPRVLPVFCSLEKIATFLVEVLSRVFKFVLDEVNPKKMEQLDAFFSNPPNFELKRRKTNDDVLYEDRGESENIFNSVELDNSEDEYCTITEVDPRQFLYKTGSDECAPKERLHEQLSAKCLYALSLFHHRANNSDEAQRFVRRCLAICDGHLDDELQSSAWFIYARSVTNTYSMMEDRDLLKHVDAFLLPFKMTIFLRKGFSDAYLDLATIIYQIRTRIKRFTEKANALTAEEKDANSAKISSMLYECRVHFQLARRYNRLMDDEIRWLSAYFLAKVAEKQGDPSAKILRLYKESAVALEQAGYQYPQKVNRTKQTNLEPLEIHYKVHSYALKTLRRLRLALKQPLMCGEFRRHSVELRTVYNSLYQFAHHAVEHRGGRCALEFYADTSDAAALGLCRSHVSDDRGVGVVDLTVERDGRNGGGGGGNGGDDDIVVQRERPACSVNAVANRLSTIDTDVVETLCEMSDVVHMMNQIELNCVQAFETVFAKFPHYKSCYRIAEVQFMKGLYRDASNTLFNRLFFAGAKRRITVTSNIFENIVEIVRADFERSGSFPYHMQKIINMAIVASHKAGELDRLLMIMHSLLTLKNEQNVPDMLDNETVKGLQLKCGSRILSLVTLIKSNSRVYEMFNHLQELIRKMARENVNYVKSVESAYQKLVDKRKALQDRLMLERQQQQQQQQLYLQQQQQQRFEQQKQVEEERRRAQAHQVQLILQQQRTEHDQQRSRLHQQLQEQSYQLQLEQQKKMDQQRDIERKLELYKKQLQQQQQQKDQQNQQQLQKQKCQEQQTSASRTQQQHQDVRQSLELMQAVQQQQKQQQLDRQKQTALTDRKQQEQQGDKQHQQSRDQVLKKLQQQHQLLKELQRQQEQLRQFQPNQQHLGTFIQQQLDEQRKLILQQVAETLKGAALPSSHENSASVPSTSADNATTRPNTQQHQAQQNFSYNAILSALASQIVSSPRPQLQRHDHRVDEAPVQKSSTTSVSNANNVNRGATIIAAYSSQNQHPSYLSGRGAVRPIPLQKELSAVSSAPCSNNGMNASTMAFTQQLVGQQCPKAVGQHQAQCKTLNMTVSTTNVTSASVNSSHSTQMHAPVGNSVTAALRRPVAASTTPRPANASQESGSDDSIIILSPPAKRWCGNNSDSGQTISTVATSTQNQQQQSGSSGKADASTTSNGGTNLSYNERMARLLKSLRQTCPQSSPPTSTSYGNTTGGAPNKNATSASVYQQHHRYQQTAAPAQQQSQEQSQNKLTTAYGQLSQNWQQQSQRSMVQQAALAAQRVTIAQQQQAQTLSHRQVMAEIVSSADDITILSVSGGSGGGGNKLASRSSFNIPTSTVSSAILNSITASSSSTTALQSHQIRRPAASAPSVSTPYAKQQQCQQRRLPQQPANPTSSPLLTTVSGSGVVSGGGGSGGFSSDAIEKFLSKVDGRGVEAVSAQLRELLARSKSGKSAVDVKPIELALAKLEERRRQLAAANLMEER